MSVASPRFRARPEEAIAPVLVIANFKFRPAGMQERGRSESAEEHSRTRGTTKDTLVLVLGKHCLLKND